MAEHPIYDREASDRHWATLRAASAAQFDEPTVDLADLSTEAKRAVWRYLKANHPAYADLLQSPVLQSMREHFDARVHLRQSLVDEALHGQH